MMMISALVFALFAKPTTGFVAVQFNSRGPLPGTGTRKETFIHKAAQEPDETHHFNGGKMQHLFEFDDSFCYNGIFSSPDAERAMLKGDLYYKIDGSNGMVQVITNEDKDAGQTLKAYSRLDTKGKGNVFQGGELTCLPSGKNPAVYKHHTYYYSLVTAEGKGKKEAKLKTAMMDLVERHKDMFISKGREWISIEWVGAKFQQTPGVPHDVAIVIHEDQTVGPGVLIERTYEGIRKFLLEDRAAQSIEGLVVSHRGVYWKVTSDGFVKDNKSPWSKNKDNARPPVFLA